MITLTCISTEYMGTEHSMIIINSRLIIATAFTAQGTLTLTVHVQIFRLLQWDFWTLLLI